MISSNKKTLKSPLQVGQQPWAFQQLPMDIQVRILSHLRAVDLSSVHQVNRYFATNKGLQHAIVVYCSEVVYPKRLTDGFEDQPITTGTSADKAQDASGKQLGRTNSTKGRKSRSSSVGSQNEETASPPPSTTETPKLYTFEHLRNMELLAVARVLNSPEPTTGFVVSKSWCKSALRWLEDQQDRTHQRQQPETLAAGNKKKVSKKAKKKLRKKTSSSSTGGTIPPPPANVNSDITCEHDQLQTMTSSRSARARRRLLDKQAWKILKALYPESTPLASISGECVQCRAEELQAQKAAADKAEVARQKRKLPLNDPNIRRFYTRTRGVPEHCLKAKQGVSSHVVDRATPEFEEDRKLPPAPPTTPDHDKKLAAVEDSDDDDYFLAHCDSSPLIDGTYFVLPRSWCHGWRRFMKTGEGGISGWSSYPAPDAASLLCDAHRMALLPPHLESFLYGETTILLGGASPASFRQLSSATDDSSPSLSAAASLPVGQGPTQESILAMRSLGLNEQEVALQLSAMRAIEARRRQQQQPAPMDNHRENDNIDTESTSGPSVSRNELLDRENHSVVEILTQAEFNALESCWPGTTVFGLRFTVKSGTMALSTAGEEGSCRSGSGISFCSPVCRSCDATGRQYAMSIKNRARGWVRKSAEKARSPAGIAEY